MRRQPTLTVTICFIVISHKNITYEMTGLATAEPPPMRRESTWRLNVIYFECNKINWKGYSGLINLL
jgi:hypothetical protein